MAVVDFVFRVDRFPTASTKAMAREFFLTGGGNAANAAIAIARLGGGGGVCGPAGGGEVGARGLGRGGPGGVGIGGAQGGQRGPPPLSRCFVSPARPGRGSY